MKAHAQTAMAEPASNGSDGGANPDNFDPYKLGFVALSKGLFESSLLELPPVARWVFIGLLAQSGVDGIVYGTDEALARKFNVPLEEFRAAIDALESPDPASTTKQHDGRRVLRQPSNTFLVVNRKLYLKMLQAPKKSYRNDTHKGEIRNSRTSTISRTTPNHVEPHSRTDAELSECEKQHLNGLTDNQKAAFWLFRGFSETAKGGEFYITQDFAAKQLAITQKGVSKIIATFVDKGILRRGSPYNVREGKSAGYYWTANEEREASAPVTASHSVSTTTSLHFLEEELVDDDNPF
jgi:hypothetical protein